MESNEEFTPSKRDGFVDNDCIFRWLGICKSLLEYRSGSDEIVAPPLPLCSPEKLGCGRTDLANQPHIHSAPVLEPFHATSPHLTENMLGESMFGALLPQVREVPPQ
jgi:hypothetical protein